jgi:hypothetical protein
MNQSQKSALSYGLTEVSALNNEFWDGFMKLWLLPLFASLGGPGSIGCQSKDADRLFAFSLLEFRISGQIAK